MTQDSPGTSLDEAVSPRMRGCLVAVLGFVGFATSPLWAVVAAEGLSSEERDHAYELYFRGLGLGAVLAAFLVWDSWRFARDPGGRPPPRGVIAKVVPLGYVASIWLRTSIEGTAWASFAIGAFGAVCLGLAVTGVAAPDAFDGKLRRRNRQG